MEFLTGHKLNAAIEDIILVMRNMSCSSFLRTSTFMSGL